MAKINVPQELANQIIDFYVNQNHTRKQIKDELNLPFSDSVIKRVLEENNVEIRSNPGAQKGGRKKQIVPSELAEKIAKLYQEGKSPTVIIDELKLPYGEEKVKSIVSEQGIKLRTLQEAQATMKQVDLRKYSINDNYDLATHNGAWLLGFIAADGYLPLGHGSQNRVVISLARQDRDVLELIKKELEYTGPLYDYEATGGYLASSLTFTSAAIRAQIESYGIGNNKTFKLQHLPKLPKELMVDFIRGYFDGDGSIYELKEKTCGSSITGANESFLIEIKEFLEQNYNIQGRIYSTERVHVIYDLKFGVKYTLLLGDLLYNNNYLALSRKKNHYFAIKEKVSHKNKAPTSLNTPKG